MPWKRSKYHTLTQSNTHSGMRKNGGNSVRLQLAIKKKKNKPTAFLFGRKATNLVHNYHIPSDSTEKPDKDITDKH